MAATFGALASDFLDVLFLAIWSILDNFTNSFSVLGVLVLLILKVAGLRVRLVALTPLVRRVQLVLAGSRPLVVISHDGLARLKVFANP